jgi:hypothetical protein
MKSLINPRAAELVSTEDNFAAAQAALLKIGVTRAPTSVS